MNETIISLLSIIFGILGANITGYIFKKYSFGIIGNTIAGVFGSIFLIKTIGRMGFDPASIMALKTVNWNLFILNSLMSFSGGGLSIIFIHKLKTSMNKIHQKNNNIGQ